MASMTGWLIALLIAVAATIVTAALNQPEWHMAATGLVSLAIGLMAIIDHHRLVSSKARVSAIGASTARHAGLLWVWGALTILITYVFIIQERWPEWWQFLLGFAFAGGISVFFANMLDKDADSGKSDAAVLKVGRLLLQVQFIGMVAAIISMFIDGKFPRDPSHADWAGCNIFFFGALTIGAISLNALLFPAHDERT
jgi:hypothetical protein